MLILRVIYQATISSVSRLQPKSPAHMNHPWIADRMHKIDASGIRRVAALKGLGSRPLAELLFHDREVRRLPLTTTYFALHSRLGRVQALSDEIMIRIGALVPVTPVALACAAIQSLDADYVSRERLLHRMEEMRDHLVELNARVIRADRDIAETFDRAWRMLKMRRILASTGDGFAVLPRNRALVGYYANSIAHLLGPFELAVRRRDSLPALDLFR